MQVDFYQLSRDPAEAVIPAIARRIVDSGERLLVVSSLPDQLGRISARLWDAGPESYLAHDRADASTPHVQPILLSDACEPVNGAQHVTLADGIWRDEALRYERVFYLFDDMMIDGARVAWRELSRRDGVAPRFWRQEGGRWRQGP